MNRLKVELAERSYEILIGQGLLHECGKHMAPVLRSKRVVIITDTHVGPLYEAAVAGSLKEAGIENQSILLGAGEQTKSFAVLEKLLVQLLDWGCDRKTTLIALGGGVIGDITGFAASILLRGVDFIQIPTTLLAQVDSSVGGKTGINAPQGKNLIGSFHQPRLVLADTDVLKTLPRRELLSGYAEVVKYGFINDAAFFAWLEENGPRGLAGDAEILATMVQKSCAAKAAVVAADEREAGLRATLNFGHTLGHALEAETGFGEQLLHGEAVAIGMALAFKLSVQAGLCPVTDAQRAERHLAGVGLKTSPLQVRPDWDAQKLITHCYHDKKAHSGGLTFILAEKIGKTMISHNVTRGELEALLAQAL